MGNGVGIEIWGKRDGLGKSDGLRDVLGFHWNSNLGGSGDLFNFFLILIVTGLRAGLEGKGKVHETIETFMK